MKPYDPTSIEPKWQQYWEKAQLFQNTADLADSSHSAKEKMYLLFAFAYPSGSGLHVGHVESKTALDILARFYRMNGKDVFFPVGWDAFGLPAENYAIKTGIPPATTTIDAIHTFRRQLKRIGISYDWAGEIATCHPGYYRWTQWIFLKLFNKGLAYQKMGKVNWCPSCQTVLANEQVVNGLCERCGTEVIQKEMKQWYFKITEYRDELISGLDTVDWPTATKQQQLNWIGKKEGVNITFGIRSDGIHSQTDTSITCFTTRIDTIFGVTFLVISPEKFQTLKLVEWQTEADKIKTDTYLDQAFKKTEEERQIGQKDKTGVDTGLKAVNPVNSQEIPIYVADYVLENFGTGAVMGVPAHDERDWAFAQKFGIQIQQVIVSDQEASREAGQSCYSGYGVLINSNRYDGLTSEKAQTAIVDDNPDYMERVTSYKLRDWLISRQRYWGAPIPIVYDPEGKPHPVKAEHLPWKLPEDVDFKPTGESPLRSSVEFQSRVEKLYGKGWTPEYDTMDTFVDSSWYYLRYTDPRNEQAFASKSQLARWLPVNFYMIGPEHIVLHLLYSRFFTKFLRDEGYLAFDEPFLKMRHQGMILGPDGRKMSKSKGNVINPDEVVAKFGADTLRIYEMFMGPIETDKPWDVSAVAGVYRFLTRIYKLILNADLTTHFSEPALQKKLHQTLKKVTLDLPALKFNTAIAELMKFVNAWEETARVHQQALTADDLELFVKMIAPLAPFLADELGEYLQTRKPEVGSPEAEKNMYQSIHLSSWPAWDAQLATADQVVIAIQINGKMRDQLTVDSTQLDQESEILRLVKAQPKVQKWLVGKKVIKEIYVPGKIVNLVIID